MKICAHCRAEKPETDFPWKYKARGIRACNCNDCNRAYRRDYYSRNRAVEIARNTQFKSKQLAAQRKMFWEVRAATGCARCREKDPACLDFHHRDPSTKSFELADLHSHGPSSKRLLAEIAKCDVLCANCHRKEHFYGSVAQSEERRSYKAHVVGATPTGTTIPLRN